MPRLQSTCASLFLMLAATFHAPAHAWGHEGHEITGRIAESLLTPQTKHELRAIMGAERLRKTSTWLDRERDALKARDPATSRWHYENRNICTGGSNAASCGEGNCATRKITDYRAVLAAPGATRAQKRMAVRVLVHLVGDIHQPLHIGDDGDRGGNDVPIIPPGGEQSTLHAFWDDYLLYTAMNGRSSRKFTAVLRARFAPELQAWMAGGEEQWAVESFDLARTFAYPALEPAACTTPLRGHVYQPAAGGSYITLGADIAARRVAMAGARIAFVLNEALDPR